MEAVPLQFLCPEDANENPSEIFPSRASRKTQWGVQIVRGRIPRECVWNACKGLSLGIMLLSFGSAVAALGYYWQEDISPEDFQNGDISPDGDGETAQRYLMYSGPAIMGIGGFVIVATCVMTLEARDKATKIVPALIKGASSKTVASLPSVDRGNLIKAFLLFSQKVQKSIDSGVDPPQVQRTLSKWSSAPNICQVEESSEVFQGSHSHTCIEQADCYEEIRSSVSSAQGRMKRGFITRQALSMEHTSPPRGSMKSVFRDPSTKETQHQRISKSEVPLTETEEQVSESSDASLALDLHTEAITLKIKKNCASSHSQRPEPSLPSDMFVSDSK